MEKNKKNKEGFREGYWEVYYAKGELWFKGNYADDICEGYWEVYHNNGKLWYKGNFLKGREIGYWEYYNKYGELECIYYFVI